MHDVGFREKSWLEVIVQLKLSNIEFTYPSAVEPALRDVTVAFSQGWTGLVGDNGSGKTTMRSSHAVFERV